MKMFFVTEPEDMSPLLEPVMSHTLNVLGKYRSRRVSISQ